MSDGRSRLLWCVIQIGALAESLLTFFVWAPWLGAKSYEEAVALYGAVVPPNCHAVAVNHGQFSCLPWGTVSSNPWGFALCTVLLLAGFAVAAVTQRKGKGFFSEPITLAVRSKLNALRARFGFGELDTRRVRSIILAALFGVIMLTVIAISTLVS